jgi:hypothetical protein
MGRAPDDGDCAAAESTPPMLRIPMRAREMESSEDEEEDEDEGEDEGLTLLVAVCAVIGGGKGDLDDEPI